MIIDTHSHLYDPDFEADFDEVVSRAQQAGVIKCILPDIDSTERPRLLQCSQKLPGFTSPTIGLHPTSVKENWEAELSLVVEGAPKGNYCAIGEIGIDGYWSKEFINEQKQVFYEQIKLADKMNLPIIIHSRDATEEIFQVLQQAKEAHLNLKGVFHAFSGSLETLKRLQLYGDFMVGIGGVVTYKNAGVAKALESIPLESILLETDSPWLTPVPFRGKRNESSYICHVVNKIASIKNIEAALVEEQTTVNAAKMFNFHL